MCDGLAASGLAEGVSADDSSASIDASASEPNPTAVRSRKVRRDSIAALDPGHPN